MEIEKKLAEMERSAEHKPLAERPETASPETGIWGKSWAVIAAATHRAYEALGGGDKKQDKELAAKKAAEIARLEELKTINGVNFSRCQMEKIADAYMNATVEFESISQYLSDHNTVTGEVLVNNLRNDEKIGIAITKRLRKTLSKSRMISIYDEYNSDMPESENRSDRMVIDKHTKRTTADNFDKADKVNKNLTKEEFEARNVRRKLLLHGAPTMNETGDPATDDLIRPIEFSDTAKKAFRANIELLYRKEGIITDMDVEGRNYLFVSESEKQKDAEILVGELKAQGYIKEEGGEIIFFNPDSENPDYKEITLRKKNGHWLCAALDASTYLKAENRSIMHLIILPDTFKEQQDKVWEILRVLDIHPTNYHNIFFDSAADPEVVAETIDSELKKYLR